MQGEPRGAHKGEGRFARLAVAAAGIGFPLAVLMWAVLSGRGLEVITEPLAWNGLAVGLFALAGLALRWMHWPVPKVMMSLNETSKRRADIFRTLAVPAIAAVLLTVLGMIEGPWLTTDSWHYLGWAAWRPAGYPAFLWLTGSIDSSLRLAIGLQIGVTFLAVELLYLQLRRSENAAPGVVIVFMLLTSLPFLYNANVMLSDQLFVCCVVLLLAAALSYLEAASERFFWAIWLLVLVAILLRPVGVTLILPVALLFWLRSPGWKSAFLRTVPPAIAVLMIVSASNQLLYGYFRPFALGGTAQIAATWCLPTGERQLSDLERKLAPIGAGLCRKLAAPEREQDWFQLTQVATTEAVSSGILVAQQHIRDTVPENSEVTGAAHLRTVLAGWNPMLGKASETGMANAWRDGSWYWPGTNDLLAEIAGRRISDAPVNYLLQSMRRLASGWLEVIPVFSARRNLDGQVVFVGDSLPKRFRRNISWQWWHDYGIIGFVVYFHDLLAAPGYLLVRHLFLPALVLVLGIWTLAAAIRRRLACLPVPPALGIAAVSALFLFTYHGAVAASAVMIPRLAAPGIAPAWVVVACGLWYLVMRDRKGSGHGDRVSD